MKRLLLACLPVTLMCACFIGTDPAGDEDVVNVYSSRHYDVDRALLKKFEEETGIQVNIITDEAEKLIARLEREGENSPCDVLITVDAANLYKASEKKILQPHKLKKEIADIPVHLQSRNGEWVALTVRSRIIAYNPDEIPADSLRDYLSLAHPFLRGKLLMRSSDNAYNRSLLSSILAHEGVQAATQWAEGVVANLAQDPSGNDRDQVKSIAAGRGTVTVINTYYLAQMLQSADESEAEAAKKIKWLFPCQSGYGAHINISGAGIARYAPNFGNAQKLIKFLLGKNAQMQLARENKEFPVLPQTTGDPYLDAWSKMKFDTLNPEKLGSGNRKAMEIISTAGWK